MEKPGCDKRDPVRVVKTKEMKIRIVNISIGTLPHKKDPEDELFLFWVERLWDAGLVVVTAAGNKGPKEGSVTIPGNSRKVITVGADEELGKKYSGLWADRRLY